jgi:hypothetical protein
MALAAFASFKIITLVRNGLAGPTQVPAASASATPVGAERPTGVASESANAAPSSLKALPPGTRLELKSQDLELPPGLAVSEDRGLLEVSIDVSQSVYVDGVFIGKGPMRQVPLREGAHEIRIQAEGVDVAQPIDIRRSRRTHVEVSRAP